MCKSRAPVTEDILEFYPVLLLLLSNSFHSGVHPRRVSAALESCWFPMPELLFLCPLLGFVVPLSFLKVTPQHAFYLFSFWNRKEGKNAGAHVFTFLSVP